ncbi:GNAT family N-acetyltransferase [Patescibacteria group bacterium]
MEDINYREATIKDAEGVAELLIEFGYPNTPTFARNKIEALTDNPEVILIIAETKGEIAGVAQLQITNFLYETGKTARIITLIVKEKYRRQGIGKTLVKKLEEEAAKVGSTKIEVTSRKDRTEAHDFYKGLGYQEASTKFSKTLSD